MRFHKLLSSLFFVGSLHLSAAGLRYPLLYEIQTPDGSYEFKLLSSFNDSLAKRQLEPIPEYVTLTNSDQADKTLAKWGTYVENHLASEPGLDSVFLVTGSLSIVASENLKENRICYVGSALESVAIIDDLISIAFSEQQNLIGWKYKDKFHIDPEWPQESNETLPEIWKQWNTKENSILYVWFETDSGDDVNAVTIPKCKK